MDLTMTLQGLTFGVLIGALYGLAAVGLSLVFGVMKVLNAAHGELIMIGGYACFWLFRLYAIDPFVALPLAATLLFALGVLLHLGLFRHVTRLDIESRIQTSLLISFGLLLILHATAILLWSADERTVATSYAALSWSVGGIRLPLVRVLSLVVALLAIFGVHLFLSRTRLGTAIRATAEDWEAATLMGVNISTMYLVAFGLGTALAAIAGSLVTVGYALHPAIGLEWTLKAMIVVVLAGLGSIGGTFLAGVLLGLAEFASIFLIGGAYRQVVGLVMFLLVLSLKPEGLFGRKAAH